MTQKCCCLHTPLCNSNVDLLCLITLSGVFSQTLENHKRHYTVVYTSWLLSLLMSKLLFICNICGLPLKNQYLNISIISKVYFIMLLSPSGRSNIQNNSKSGIFVLIISVAHTNTHLQISPSILWSLYSLIYRAEPHITLISINLPVVVPRWQGLKCVKSTETENL